MTTVDERRETIDILEKMIDEIEVAMLTTRDADGALRSRPMLATKTRFDGDLWFFVNATDSVVADMRENQQVNLSFACPSSKRYASFSGTATMMRDQRKTEALWRPELSEWFPDGVEQSSLMVLKVTVDRAQYWDRHRNPMGQLVDSVKSWVTGENQTEERQGDIDWANRPPEDESSSNDESTASTSPRATIMSGKELTEYEKKNV